VEVYWPVARESRSIIRSKQVEVYSIIAEKKESKQESSSVAVVLLLQI